MIGTSARSSNSSIANALRPTGLSVPAIGRTKAETSSLYAASGLIPPDVLARAVRNQVVEDGLYPGIEAAYGGAGEKTTDD